MLSRFSFALTVVAIAICILVSCTHDPQIPVTTDNGYPPDIANIITTRCAISGCHNQASYINASGLLLDTWDHMFNGDDFGAVVVPYWPQYSPLLYFVNSDATLGPILSPQMPVAGSAPALTKDEYLKLSNWVAAGAPDKNGNIPFATEAATRQKIYGLCNDYGVDLLAVIDAKRHVIMRYIKVGANDAVVESGHDLAPSVDGSTIYESFVTGSVLQKADMLNDVAVSTASLHSDGANTNWALLCLNDSNTRLMVTNWADKSIGGRATSVNTTTMTEQPQKTFSPLNYPHGIVSNKSFDTFFVTASNGNCIYKLINPLDSQTLISLDNKPATDVADNLGPHAIWMAPDYSRYFVTCQNSNEVRVMDAHADTLMAVIPVGGYPQEIEASSSPLTPYVFVTCRNDSTAFNPKGSIGSVYVINYNTMQFVKAIYSDFRQPHGITVDNQNNLLYVFSLNMNGPPQHHDVKNYRSGWYTIIDIATLAPYNFNRYGLLANPYEGAARFK